MIAANPGFNAAVHSPSATNGEIQVHVVPKTPSAFGALATRLAAVATRLRNPTGGSSSTATIPAQVVRREDLSYEVSLENIRKVFRMLVHHTGDLAWMEAAEQLGNSLARDVNYDVIVSSGPPHLAAEGARRISKRFGIPLVVDFRDPWAQIDMLQQDVATPLHFSLATHYERKIMRRASLVVMNTDAATRAMRMAYPSCNVVTVRNGFDGTHPTANHGAKFVALYAGAIYLDRDPRPLLRALRMAASRTSISPETFVLRFIGGTSQFGGSSLQSLAADAQVEQLVQVTGQLKRDELHRQMAEAALLVNLPQGARLCIPSKVYEYLNFPAWILAMEPEVSATRDLLSSTSADVVDPDDTEAIAAVLQSRFERYAHKGERPKAIGADGAFSAEKQASLFFNAINSVLPMVRKPQSSP